MRLRCQYAVSNIPCTSTEECDQAHYNAAIVAQYCMQFSKSVYLVLCFMSILSFLQLSELWQDLSLQPASYKGDA